MKSELPGLAQRIQSQLQRLIPARNRATSTAGDPLITFQCNICSASCVAPLSRLTREEPTCQSCGSTVRMRTIIHALSTELFGASLALDDFPSRPDITGLGLSDWEIYAARLAEKFHYQNTYFDQEPSFDIRNPADAERGPVDFLIATDVFEHVAPPITLAFNNAHRLLTPGGLLIFSVPYATEPGTVTQEHFPELHDFSIVERDGRHELVNTTVDGRSQVFTDLVFHGGVGLTLEMRLFSEESLRLELTRAGFDRIRIFGDPELKFGVHWPSTPSRVWSARAS